jgi:hypothetical protein
MRKPRRRRPRSPRGSPSPGWQFLGRAGLYLAIGVPAVAIMGTAWFYSPDITIRTAAISNPIKVSDIEFIVSNTSRITVYNLLFQCEMILQNGARFTTSGNIVQLPSGRVAERSVATLLPNETITRNCGLGASTSPTPAFIIATARYTWPVVKWTGSSTRRFSSRQDQKGGIVLAPEP